MNGKSIYLILETVSNGPGWSPSKVYRIKEIRNSRLFDPGKTISPNEIDDLIDHGWTVVIRDKRETTSGEDEEEPEEICDKPLNLLGSPTPVPCIREKGHAGKCRVGGREVR